MHFEKMQGFSNNTLQKFALVHFQNILKC